MLDDLLEVSPYFNQHFNSFITLDYQKKMMKNKFLQLQKEFMSSDATKLQLLEMKKNPRRRGYFFTNRKFDDGMVFERYHRKDSPRISAFNSTLYGMKKFLKSKINLV